MKHNWEYKRLGEVGEIITGSTPSTKKEEYYSSKDYMFVKPGDIEENSITLLTNTDTYVSQFAFDSVCRQLPKHSILVTCIGTIGKVGILNEEATFNQQINAVICYPENYYKFIAYAILSIKKLLNSKKNGPVVPIINKSFFSKFSIPVPPRDVQERIVAELDAINEGIAELREQVKDLDSLAKTLFYETFGDPISNPKAWPVKKLDEICDAISTGITYKPEMVDDCGTIVLRSNNIQDNEFVLDDIVRVNMLLKPSQYVQQNDILMCSRNGSARLVGKVAIIPELSEPMSWGAFMTKIRSPYFLLLFYYFQLPAFREQLTKTKTTTVNQITISMLKKIVLPFPPLSLQQQFAAQIEEIEVMKRELEAQIAEAQTLFDSRMEYWFN